MNRRRLNRIAHAIDIAGALRHGKGHDVGEMVVENIP
jgi:hypothetical protein